MCVLVIAETLPSSAHGGRATSISGRPEAWGRSSTPLLTRYPVTSAERQTLSTHNAEMTSQR